jgi:5-methylcytosine-specific restriction endonuclease McrA
MALKVTVYSYVHPSHTRKGKRRGGPSNRQVRKLRNERLAAKQKPGYVPYQPDLTAAAFCQTFEWKKLRLSTFRKYGYVCHCCGATRKEAILQIDHIKPRFLFPKLELDPSNLQVLCKECNHRKGLTTKDWRPKRTAPQPRKVSGQQKDPPDRLSP